MAWYDKYTRKGSNLGSLASLAPGGAKADWGSVAKNTINTAGELSGAYDIGRGINQIATSGILPGGKKADWTRAASGLGNTLLGATTAIPVGGALLHGATKAATTTAKAVKAEQALAKATAAISRQTPTFTKAAQGLTKASDYANKKLVTSILPKTTSKLPGFIKPVAKAVTTPFALGIAAQNLIPGGSNVSTSQTLANQTAGTTPTATNNTTTTTGNTPTTTGTTTGSTTGTSSSGSAGVNPVANIVASGIGSSPTPVLTAKSTPTNPLLNAFTNYASTVNTTAPAPIGTVGTTANPAALPGAVSAEAAQYGADLASAAQNSYAAQAANRETLSQNMIRASGIAADIYGGRAPAIMGQAITGGQRNYVTDMAAQAQTDLAKEAALAKGYSSNVISQYDTLANNALKRARANADTASKMRALG